MEKSGLGHRIASVPVAATSAHDVNEGLFGVVVNMMLFRLLDTGVALPATVVFRGNRCRRLCAVW